MKKMFKRFVYLGLLLALTLPAIAQPSFPEVIPLPNGWGPEGIAIGPGTDFYAGARQMSPFAGAIYKGDLRTGAGGILVPSQPGRFALGLKLDKRSNLLFVAGGPSGRGFIYDGETGANVADFQFANAPTFVNDVVVTKRAAFFTDSLTPVLYRVPLLGGGLLPEPPVYDVIPLSGDFQSVPGFNSNGIEATPNGESLVVVNSAAGLLYRVDPETGEASLIDLGGALVTNGDGILLDGHTLYVCRNALNRIAVIELNRDLTAGTYLTDILSPDFRIPTTLAEFGHSLYAVNSRFNAGPPSSAIDYEIVRVSK